MKQKHWLRIVLLLVGVLLVMCLHRSCSWSNPPSVDKIESIFQKNQDDIQYVTEWLLNLEYEHVFFSRDDLARGEVWADFSHIPLEPDILERVKRLMWIVTDGIGPISKSSMDNAITFSLMRDSFGAECGVVYAIDSTREPCVEFQISVEPISEENWFYFYSDYEEWRVLRTAPTDE